MAACNILSMPAARACSGKCKSPCSAEVLVLAGCEGMVMPYRRNALGALMAFNEGPQSPIASFDVLRDMLAAIDTDTVERILIIGSPNDMAWMRAALPDALANRITAEIQYPLLPAWFRGDARETGLNKAISDLLMH